jgi:hypothetical protein
MGDLVSKTLELHHSPEVHHESHRLIEKEEREPCWRQAQETVEEKKFVKPLLNQCPEKELALKVFLFVFGKRPRESYKTWSFGNICCKP